MDDKQRSIISVASTESSIAYFHDGDIVKPAITNEYGFIWDMNGMVTVLKNVIKTDDILFSAKVYKHTGRKYVHATVLGKSFLSTLKFDVGDIKKTFPMHKFNPYIEMFMPLIEQQHLDHIPEIIKALSDKEAENCVGYLNKAVADLRKQGRSEKFRSQIDANERSGNKNYAGLTKYIDAHFAVSSRILVIRLDLHYHNADDWPMRVESQVTYIEVKKHWKMMLHYLRNKLPGDCFLGFAWKLEYGAKKGFHYHLLLLLNGAKVQEDVTIARLIGEHWGNAITLGKGYYYNCNRMKAKYKSCGIGMVNHSDIEMRKDLSNAAIYLTKTDYFIKLVAPGGGRIFGKGNMPKPKSTKKGRPRKVIQPDLNCSQIGF